MSMQCLTFMHSCHTWKASLQGLSRKKRQKGHESFSSSSSYLCSWLLSSDLDSLSFSWPWQNVRCSYMVITANGNNMRGNNGRLSVREKVRMLVVAFILAGVDFLLLALRKMLHLAMSPRLSNKPKIFLALFMVKLRVLKDKLEGTWCFGKLLSLLPKLNCSTYISSGKSRDLRCDVLYYVFFYPLLPATLLLYSVFFCVGW
jgi:hypothetical protein